MEKIINIPNTITLIRIFIILPPAIYFLVIKNTEILIILLIFFFILDAVDGYLAKRYNQSTQTGKLLEGIADTLGLLVIMAYYYLSSILSLIELFFIILPRLLYYLIIFFIKFKYNQLIQTYWWKLNLVVWLALFATLLFTGHNIGVLIGFNIVLYTFTILHFIVVFRKLYFKTESKMIIR